MGNEIDSIKELLRTTPTYMSHVTVGRWLLEALLKEIEDLKRRVKELENDRKK